MASLQDLLNKKKHAEGTGREEESRENREMSRENVPDTFQNQSFLARESRELGEQGHLLASRRT